MNMPINNASQTSQPVSTGQGGIASANKIGSAEFSSLFATLLGLTAPTNNNAQTQTTQTTPTSLASVGAGLTGLNFTPEAAASETDNAASPEDLLANLFDALKTLSQTAAAGNKTDPALVGQITDAIEALTALIGSASASAPTSEITTAPAQQLPIDGLPKELKALIAQITERGDNAAPKLAEIAQKLSVAQPELATKLQGLAQKLIEIAPQPTNQPAPAPTTANTQIDPEIASAVNLLFASKETAPKETGNNTQSKFDASAKTEQSNPDLLKTNIADLRADTQTKPDTTRSATNASKAAPAVLAAAGADAGPQTDPLLLAQSIAQSGTKADFAIAVKPMTAAYQTPTPQLNMPHIAFEMAHQLRNGNSRFQIRLDPPEMGKIDVKMDIDRAGNITAKMVVERADTLELLQRDSRALERALSQAGLDNARTNLEFSLKQNPFARQDGQMGNDGSNSDDPIFGENELDNDDQVADIPAALLYRGTASPGGVNMLA